MLTVILITLFMLIVFGLFGVVVYLMVKKVDPHNQDVTEKENITSAQEFLPFEDITNNMIILGNHKYRAVLSCSSTNYQLKTAAEREQIEIAFQRFINSITFFIYPFFKIFSILVYWENILFFYFFKFFFFFKY